MLKYTQEAEDSNHYELIYEDNTNDLDLVLTMKEIEKCDVMEWGLKEHEAEFYFCSCDADQKDPICIECKEKCHSGHSLSPSPYKLINICQCGLKNHNITSSMKNENFYLQNCFFHELSIVSNTNNYYQITDDYGDKITNICLFCMKFCETNSLEKITNIELKHGEVPDCKCTNTLHAELKNIYSCINRFYREDNFKFLGDLTPCHMLNAFFKTEKLLKNIFSSFINYMIKLRESVKKPDFEFDPRMNFSSFYWSLQNFATISKQTKKLHYFSKEVRCFFSHVLTYDVLEQKFDSSNQSTWEFKNYFLICFKKITLGTDFCKIAKCSIEDFENMTPLQRIIFVSNIKKDKIIISKYIEDPKENIIEKLLNVLQQLNKIHSHIAEGYSLIFNLISILKKFAKFYLFTKEQKLKFCFIIDELFHKIVDPKKYSTVSRKKNTKNQQTGKILRRKKERKALTDIMQTLIYFALAYNDQNIFNNLNDNIDINAKFFHTKNEMGKYISKNCINVLNHIRKDMENEYKDKYLKKILIYSNKLLSLCLNSQDFYLIGFKKCLDKNLEYTTKLSKNQLTKKENEFVNHLDNLAKELEEKYADYYNFKINIKILNLSVKKEIISFFNFINIKESNIIDISKLNVSVEENYESMMKMNKEELNHSFHDHKTASGLEYFKKRAKLFETWQKTHMADSEFNNNINNDLTEFSCRFLMNKSNFIFSLVKVLEINSIFYEGKKNMGDIDESVLEMILKVLYFYIINNPDNAIISLSRGIVGPLITVSTINVSKVLDFLYCCVYTISAHKYELAYSYKYVKILRGLFIKANNVTNY